MLSFSNYSNSQDILSTGNLVSQTTWDGCASYLKTRIWGGYSGGPCPNVGLDGTGINYSYGQYTLSQTIAINKALQDTGVQINGYNYRWDVKNSNINGQQGGSYDPVALINVQVKDTKGTPLVSETYNYGYHLPNWTTFSGTQTFANSYVANTLGSIGLSVTSKDSGYWAGYYGPEFRNFSLSLNYTAAPPPPPPPVVTTSVPKSDTVTYTAATVVIPTGVDNSSVPTSTVSVGGVQLSTTGTISAPDNIPQVLKDTQAITQQSTSLPTASAKPSVNMSLVMSVINQVQANDKATQTAAVKNANQVTSTSASMAQDQANQVVESLNTMSQTSSQISMIQFSSQSSTISTQSFSLTSSLVSQPTLVAPITTTSTYSSTQNTQQTFNNFSLTAPTSSTSSQATVAQPDTQIKFDNKQLEIDMPTLSFSSSSSRSTGVNDLFASNINFESLQSEQTTDAVKKNITTNDLAGGVDIASIATMPKGYEAYSFVLQDANFYKVEAIYKDQKTVDNARALRQLSSDRLHQMMIDQQYKGN